MVTKAKHSDSFTQVEVDQHNQALQKVRENWLSIGICQRQVDFVTDVTLSYFKCKPGFYAKFKGKWLGPYNTETECIDTIDYAKYESAFC
jgi:hypothetical protein